MTNENILAVDDEKAILELLKYNLAREGYRVSLASTGEDAIRTARAKLPDLILLDLMLPGLNGLEVCRALKSGNRTAHIAVVMLTARGDESDIVAGLELGADDYVAKPFSPKVLMARVRAVLRRKAADAPRSEVPIKDGDLEVDPSRHEVLLKGKLVEMTHTEFRILHLLASSPGRVYTRYQIMDAVHGSEHVATDRSIDVQITGLRKKMGPFGRLIETVRGVGYRFED